MMPETTLENSNTISYTARWFNEKSEKYNAACWKPRSYFSPQINQASHPGSQVGWHPGNRQHQWSGRKLALLLLHALAEAFDRWEEGVDKYGYPLAASYWHIGDSYKIIRENLRTHITTPKFVDGVNFTVKNAYDGFDPLLFNQAIPDGDIDVHAIATATTNPAPILDHSWLDDPATRHELRQASEFGFMRET